MLFLIAAAVAAISCPIEQAHYVMRGAPDVTAGFVKIASNPDWPSGLVYRITFRSSGRHYDFLPWNGGSDEQQHMAWVTDADKPGFVLPSPDGGPGRHGDIAYIGTDADYNVLGAAPNHKDTAPAHILLPDLRRIVWYSNLSARDGAPKQFFDLVGCAK
jgi:hypothetical protein